MYILIIARGYPTEAYKMNGIFEFDQAKALIREGHKVIYAPLDLRSFKRKRKWGLESLNKEEVIIEGINIPCGAIPKKIFNKISTLALRILFNKIQKKYGTPDVVHSHFINLGNSACTVFHKTNIPILLTEHYSAMNQNEISPYLMELGKKTYPKVDQLVSVSKALSKNIKEKFNVNSVVIHNTYDNITFSYNGIKKKNRDFDFISVGSLTKNKGMDILIKAFNEAFEKKSKVKLFIYGEGKERTNLENLIINLGLSEKVFLKGLVNREEIAEKYLQSNCFVLTSQSETFGVAYIEALSTGLPVIATKCGGPEEFVNKENGLLVPKNDIEAIKNALNFMFNNAKNYDPGVISEFINSNYSPQEISKKLVALYKEVIKNYYK